ncbi:helix-turn-helix domain-containing protein [Actinoallomurus purpureus]|uniref:helix-turn-helix domain-containing protein n=1 Tax=Actinoallomurus purpureus TaxID=478114 RepID=UPI002092FE41|nr:helix-turn-helix transcriptional regulator [Actinoallomurus purpureus]MCO6005547.1 helix-turn-helix domain-containing protein [Actinoallomurus purpureus]
MRSPTLIALGSELRRYRLAAGNMTQGHLAKLINYSEGMISNVETAQKVPRRDFVERCDQALSTGGALLVLHGLLKHETHPVQSFARYAEAEHQASGIHMWDVVVIPGIFQTPEYARALLTAGRPAARPEIIEDLVTARIERQDILFREKPPVLWAVIDESTLRREIGSKETQRAQLDRLVELARQPGINVQVIPLATGAHAGLTSSFIILSFDGSPDMAYSEDPATNHLHEKPELVKTMSETYEALRVLALPVSASLDLIQQIQEEL